MNVFQMVLITLFCSSVMSMLGGCDVTKSHVVFETKEHEFTETIILGSEIVTAFTFKNEGNGPLQIERLETDCRCVTTNTSEKLFNPVRVVPYAWK